MVLLTRYVISIPHNEQNIVGERLNRTVTVPGLGTYTCSDIKAQAYGPGVNSSICDAFQQDIVRSTCCRSVCENCNVCRSADEMSRSTEDCKFGVND